MNVCRNSSANEKTDNSRNHYGEMLKSDTVCVKVWCDSSVSNKKGLWISQGFAL